MNIEQIADTLNEYSSIAGDYISSYPIPSGMMGGAILGALAGQMLGGTKRDIIGGSLVGSGAGGAFGMGYEGYENYMNQQGNSNTV